MKHLAKRTLFLVLGHLMAILAILGAIIPILPHTPFAIFAAYFYSKSSPRLHSYILSIPTLGPAIDEWDNYRIIRRRAKIISVLMMLGGLGSSLYFTKISWAWKAVQTVLIFAVLVFVITRDEELPSA